MEKNKVFSLGRGDLGRADGDAAPGRRGRALSELDRDRWRLRECGCSVGDATLIQARIGHDIDATGAADYCAWWEPIPAPLVRTALAVRPGDRVGVAIFERRVPKLWTIAIANFSTGSYFTITLPCTSSYLTAEWVIETPLVITDSGIQVGPMPSLTMVRFDDARADGAAAAFAPHERTELVDFNLRLIASPSMPDAQGDGFNDCTYAATCPAP